MNKKITGSRAKAIKKAMTNLGGLAGFAKALFEHIGKKKGLEYKQCYLRSQKWVLFGVAPRFVLDVEAISGVSRHDLDPELYPRD